MTGTDEANLVRIAPALTGDGMVELIRRNQRIDTVDVANRLGIPLTSSPP